MLTGAITDRRRRRSQSIVAAPPRRSALSTSTATSSTAPRVVVADEADARCRISYQVGPRACLPQVSQRGSCVWRPMRSGAATAGAAAGAASIQAPLLPAAGPAAARTTTTDNAVAGPQAARAHEQFGGQLLARAGRAQRQLSMRSLRQTLSATFPPMTPHDRTVLSPCAPKPTPAILQCCMLRCVHV